MDTVIFAPDLIEYAFVGVALSDAKFMNIKIIHTTRFVLVKLLIYVSLFNAKKSMSESILRLKWLQLLLLGGGTAENREHGIKGRCFPCILIWNARRTHFMNLYISLR